MPVNLNPPNPTSPRIPNISKGNDQNNKTLTFQISNNDNGTYTITGLDAILQIPNSNPVVPAASPLVLTDVSGNAGPYSVLSSVSAGVKTYTIEYAPAQTANGEPVQGTSNSAQIQVDP